jgi:ABC-2 type transport system permease protein
MQIFKAYFKVIKKNLPSMSIYFFIFLFFSIMLTSLNSGTKQTSFDEAKSRIAIINYDNNSVLINDLKSHLKQYASIVEIKDEKQELQDALFFRKVEYIIKIPKGFTNDFLASKDVTIEKTTVPDSITALYMDNILNKYLNTAKLYIKNVNGITEEKLTEYLKKDLEIETKVEVNSFGKKVSNTQNISYLFSYFAYSLFAIIFYGVTSNMMVFNQTDLKRRNLCSPIKEINANAQMVLANLVFVLVVWASMVLVAAAIFREAMLNLNVLFMLINSLIFTFVCLSISFLVGNLIKSRGVQSALSNVLTLGLSFISGVFVPQELLGESVLNIAKITPTFWYVKANNSIFNLSSFKIENMSPIINSFLIQLGFAVGLLIIAFVIIKQKRVTKS